MPPLVLAYLVPRTIAALGVAVLQRRSRGTLLPLAGRLAVDLAAAALIVAFADYDVRRWLGGAAVALFALVAGWEAVGAVRRWRALDAPAAATSWTAIVSGPWRWMWDLVIVAPPVLAGLAVAADVVVPGQLPFPNRPPPIRCTPETLGPQDTLRIRLEVPHGGELGIGTPAGRFLVVVPFAPAAVPARHRFERASELRLSAAGATGRLDAGAPLERVFVDTGSYFVRVSDVAELAASLVCRVRVVSAGAAAPPPPR